MRSKGSEGEVPRCACVFLFELQIIMKRQTNEATELHMAQGYMSGYITEIVILTKEKLCQWRFITQPNKLYFVNLPPIESNLFKLTQF